MASSLSFPRKSVAVKRKPSKSASDDDDDDEHDVRAAMPLPTPALPALARHIRPLTFFAFFPHGFLRKRETVRGLLKS